MLKFLYRAVSPGHQRHQKISYNFVTFSVNITILLLQVFLINKKKHYNFVTF